MQNTCHFANFNNFVCEMTNIESFTKYHEGAKIGSYDILETIEIIAEISNNNNNPPTKPHATHTPHPATSYAPHTQPHAIYMPNHKPPPHTQPHIAHMCLAAQPAPQWLSHGAAPLSMQPQPGREQRWSQGRSCSCFCPVHRLGSPVPHWAPWCCLWRSHWAPSVPWPGPAGAPFTMTGAGS